MRITCLQATVNKDIAGKIVRAKELSGISARASAKIEVEVAVVAATQGG
jgi:hypothetical protein